MNKTAILAALRSINTTVSVVDLEVDLDELAVGLENYMNVQHYYFIDYMTAITRFKRVPRSVKTYWEREAALEKLRCSTIPLLQAIENDDESVLRRPLPSIEGSRQGL